ncbi:MAG: phosphopantetheine-binding protein [Alistipes sp.]
MLSKEQIIKKLTELLSEEFEVNAADITAESSLKETFGLDSLDLVDVIVLIHENFGIKLNGPDFAKIKTFGNFCDLIVLKSNELHN